MKEASNDSDAVDNVVFVQENQALLTLGSVKENELLHKKCYPECIAHIIYDLMDGRKPRVMCQFTPSSVIHEKTIGH